MHLLLVVLHIPWMCQARCQAICVLVLANNSVICILYNAKLDYN